MNTHEYEKIKFMKNSWSIHDNSCRKKTRIARNYPLIIQKLFMIIRVYS